MKVLGALISFVGPGERMENGAYCYASTRACRRYSVVSGGPGRCFDMLVLHLPWRGSLGGQTLGLRSTTMNIRPPNCEGSWGSMLDIFPLLSPLLMYEAIHQSCPDRVQNHRPARREIPKEKEKMMMFRAGVLLTRDARIKQLAVRIGRAAQRDIVS